MNEKVNTEIYGAGKERQNQYKKEGSDEERNKYMYGMNNKIF